MNMRDKLAGEIEDPAVAEALNNFKASMNAWSEAAYNRPRTVVNPARPGWRLAASWTLGCVLVAGAGGRSRTRATSAAGTSPDCGDESGSTKDRSGAGDSQAVRACERPN